MRIYEVTVTKENEETINVRTFLYSCDYVSQVYDFVFDVMFPSKYSHVGLAITPYLCYDTQAGS